MPKRLTKPEVINRANKIHNSKYTYPNFHYTSRRMIIEIVCPNHGLFSQTISDHLYSKAGCPKCKSETLRKLKTKPFEYFKERANLVHNFFYDYLEAEKVYVGSRHKVPIICPLHGEFLQTFRNHVNAKAGCQKCSGVCKPTNDECIEQFHKIHNNKFDYPKVNYINSRTKVLIICPDHGEFEQTPHDHKSGVGCPKCNSSKGERQIEQYLIENNIKFITQKRFKDCRNKYPLPFDFYLPEYNTCIEYDGEQHFRVAKHWGGQKAFKQIQVNDKIKNNFCKENNVTLIRISYKDNIESSLESIH